VSQIDIRLEGPVAPGAAESEPPWLEGCRRFVAAALRELGAANWELSILFCGDAFIRELNRRYRGLEGPTDVLSFSQGSRVPGAPGKGQVAGDIVISLQTLERNAQREGEPRERELKRLLIHGMLHLQGLDHPEEGDSEMLKVQEGLLERLRGKRIGL
jgi:probable rRNA maturation factor